MLKRIKLLGAAGREFGREFSLDVASPAEAVRALCVLHPEFHGWVLEQHQRGVAWRVVTDDPTGLAEDELTRETGSETIIFAPVLQGSGGGGSVFKIIVGVALVAVGILFPQIGTIGVKLLITVGSSLALSGVADLLTKTPTLGGADSAPTGTAAERTADLESNLFSRNQGTAGQGECVPLLYGRRRVESPRIISFDLRNSTESRQINTSGTRGLLGYVNSQTLT